ncbi:MAG: hypothetical protein KBT32_09790 [Bacteroidales bacterium]|nr:hypothetical protein [Candidatus Physcocola equi]
MKKNSSKYLIAAIIAILAFSVHCAARDITINVSKISGELTKELRTQLEPCMHHDNVVVNFDKAGTYTISGTIECKANIEIKGTNKKKVSLIFDKGSAPNASFTDDTFFKISGTKKLPISVSIHDITFRLKDHKGIWWENSPMFMVKIYHANKVNIHHVNSYTANALCTNFDLRVCSNISVTDCDIANYNNSNASGNLWVRGNTKNVTIKNNKFYKHGNDEVVGFFERTVDAISGKQDDIQVKDIYITDNTFVYRNNEGTKKEVFCDAFLSILTEGEDTTYRTSYENVNITNNTFSIDGLVRRLISLRFSPVDLRTNFNIAGNVIENGRIDTDEKYYHFDICLNDYCKASDPIRIKNNSVNNYNDVINPYSTPGYTFLFQDGGNVAMEGNEIISNITKSNITNIATGIGTIWVGNHGGFLNMTGNNIEGAYVLASVSNSNTIKSFMINAENNTFEGDTRIYCNNVSHLDLTFVGNVFRSSNMNFFLQEFAKEGSLVFKNNEVYATDGQLMTHWANTSTSAMRFTTLEVTGNTFYGTNGEKNVFSNITNVRQKNVKGNIYYGK